MKQILYFLIGFLIATIPLKIAYAGCIDCDPILTVNNAFFHGYYDDFASANAAGSNIYYYNGTLQVNGTNLAVTTARTYCSFSDGIPFNYGLVRYQEYIPPAPVKYHFYAYYISGALDHCAYGDTDEDGIPDECDIYPNDPTPYKVRAVSYQTSDNTFNGPRIYQWMHTDRGQTYELGTKDPQKSDFLTYSSPWEDPPTTCTGIDTTPENSEPIPENNPYTTDPPTGEPSETDTDPAFQPGEVSNGTETGDGLLRDIKTNTGKIATNTDRLGDYMKELTKAIQGMDRNTAIITGTVTGATGTGTTGTGTTTGDQGIIDAIGSGTQGIIDAIGSGTQGIEESISVRDQANDTEAQGYKSNAEGLTDSSNYDGTLIEGTDYQPTPQDDLANESWLTGFMNDNPIQDWIDASGFDTSGSVCSLSFVHPRYGNLSFSLCNFENDFALAGNILFGLCSLYGLMTIIRG